MGIREKPKLKQLLSSLNWIIVNDTVMGGQSFSTLSETQSMICFEGKLSSANNGGFSSVHCHVKSQIRDDGKISITVKGDNRRYQLRLKTAHHADMVGSGAAYKVEFNNKEGWHSYTFEQQDFVATYRGKVLNDEPALKFSDICQIGFLIADKQWEEFKLDIKDISFNNVDDL